MPAKLKPLAEPARPIDTGVRIGHVHLKVADLDRALGFYTGVLGFELMQRYGHQAAFVSAGGYHHRIGLNTWESRGGSPPAPGTTGLYHVAIPTRPAPRSPRGCSGSSPPTSRSTARATTA
jgi:catechol 2,3-dioxygenase